jgi:histidine ammonia-lyase
MAKQQLLPSAAALLCAGWAWAASADPAYTPINPTRSDEAITLTGQDLTVEQVVDVARYGAKVRLSAQATQRAADNYGLLLEGAAEGMAIYGFNRGGGDQREVATFSGNPLSAENRALLARRNLLEFQAGAIAGNGPEVADEEIVRAMMVVRANAMTNNAPSPQLAQMLVELLNRRVTPVVQARGTVGEGDLAQLSNVAATMVGSGAAYYQGQRMTAAAALARAGLAPLQPSGGDSGALMSSDAYATGTAALVVSDARRALEWADLVYAMDLNGMNSSITPLCMVVQRDRPFKWLNWDAARVLGMLRGSYLFNGDPNRIIQDPESLRASSIRQASAWQAWAALRDSVATQMNSSDHNPAIRTDLSPGDSWELSTPQLMKYYVKGGPLSHGMHGYIVSNANWDPYPMANELEAFVIAMANMDVAISLRIERFNNPFFTVVTPTDVFHDKAEVERDWGYAQVDLDQEIQSLATPVAPSGAALASTVEDLQAQTRVKAARARQVVATTFDLLGHDVLSAALWMDVRKTQDSSRAFGDAPAAAWVALRKLVPRQVDTAHPPSAAPSQIAAAFLVQTPAASFFTDGPPMPASN